MIQRDRIFAALVAAGSAGLSVKEIQEQTGIGQPGTVRRELGNLKYQYPPMVRRDPSSMRWFSLTQTPPAVESEIGIDGLL